MYTYSYVYIYIYICIYIYIYIHNYICVYLCNKYIQFDWNSVDANGVTPGDVQSVKYVLHIYLPYMYTHSLIGIR